LKRYVYDGGQLVQEHDWTVTDNFGTWVYTYADINRDYLRHQGGIRQREGTAASYNDFYLQQSGAAIEIKTQRDQASATIARAERTQSLNQMAGTTFTDISNLATSNSPIAMFGGGTSGGTAGFDGLVQRYHGNHLLVGISKFIARKVDLPHSSGGLEQDDNASNGTSCSSNEDYGMKINWPPLPIPTGKCSDDWNSNDCCPLGADDCIKEQQSRFGGIVARHTEGWYPFCCLPECDIPDTLQVGLPIGPGACIPPIGGNCKCDHCDWSFGFAGLCGIPWHTIDNSCAGLGILKSYLDDTIQAYTKACSAAQCCGCNLFRIDRFNSDQQGTTLSSIGATADKLGANWQTVIGCLSDICRGSKQITLACSRDKHEPGEQYNYEDWKECYGKGNTLAFAQVGGNRIVACVDHLANETCPANTMLHELMHTCGATHPEGEDLALANYCIPDEAYCSCRDNFSISKHPCALNQQSAFTNPCAAFPAPSLATINKFL
jgi:hypothetical protein